MQMIIDDGILIYMNNFGHCGKITLLILFTFAQISIQQQKHPFDKIDSTSHYTFMLISFHLDYLFTSFIFRKNDTFNEPLPTFALSIPFTHLTSSFFHYQ